MSGLLRTALAVLLVAGGLAAQAGAPPGRGDGAASAANRVAVHVDPRVELLTIVARLAEFPEFSMENSRSPYAERVDKRFGKLKKHAAVGKLAALRAARGVSFDAIPSLAVHLDAVPTLAERVPFDAPPERLDARWGGAGARDFLEALRDFAKVSDAAAFFESERTFYAEVEKRLAERLAQSRALPWFDDFFGPRTGASYVAIPGLLCGSGNFGVGIRFPDRRPEEITPVFGCWTWDGGGLPVFGAQYLPLFVHELCHSYTNPIVDRHRAELQDAADRLYATCATTMQPQGYGSGIIVLYESLVRAAVVRCRLATESQSLSQAQAAEEVGNGFLWVPKLALLLGEYDEDHDQWPDFDAFMPKIVAFFDKTATEQAAVFAATPQLVSIDPANGAKGVNPAQTVMTIRFDRPMRDQSWSITGASADTPAITGELSYDAEHRVLSVPVKLERGRTYVFSLNSTRNQGFVSEGGMPLKPVPITFSTRR